MVYFAATVIYITIQTGEGGTLTQVQAYVNFGTNLIQLIYLSVDWLRRKLRRWYLPIALINATVIPIFSNLIYLANPLIITRSWLILPILIVPIVLIAWQYKFRFVVLIVFFSTYVELFVLVPHVNNVNMDAFLILGGPLIRAIAIGTVGLIVNRLVALQNLQRRELIQANIRLSEHTQTLEKLAVSRERNRIARELHDTLAHTLSGQAVNLEAIKLMIPETESEIHEMLDQSLGNTRSGLAETRRALKSLRSQRLEDTGLLMAINDLAMDAKSRGGFNLNISLPDNLPDITPDVEQSIFRIIQESLQNIIRHASANNVNISVEQSNQHLLFLISDDGVGFDVSEIDLTNKMGLKGIVERVEIMGGKFSIHSDMKHGTTIRLKIPIWNVK
jgi:signal transduction histidine kinase